MKFLAVPVLAALVLGLGAGAEQAPVLDGAGEAALAVHQKAIAAAAPIYGYDLTAGDWTIRQISCAAMPETVMLRYTRRFQDGAESLFTVLAPRGAGSVSIVPVLYAGRTPFTTAPDNPRNVALFNRLIAASGVRRGPALRSQWRELGACYAYMTGANAIAGRGRSIGIAGAPAPFLRVDGQGKGATLTFADRDSFGAYRLWSLRFDGRGRLKAASARDYAVSSAKPRLGRRSRAAERMPKETAKRFVATRAKAPMPEQPEVTAALPPSNAVLTPSNPADEQAGGQRVGSTAGIQAQKQGTQAREQGWKLMGNPPQPPSKFVPDAPQPPAKFIPNPPNPPGNN